VEDENNFKTAQQKARAEFFKEMYEEGKDEKTKTTETSEETPETTEEENTSEKHDTSNEVSVSLIGSPQCDDNHDEGNPEETKTGAGTETIEISEEPVQVQVDDHVTQDEQEIEKESLSAASTEHEVPNEVEEMQFVIVPEEEKSDEILTDEVVHGQNEEKETEQNSELAEDLETTEKTDADVDEDTDLANDKETHNTDGETDECSEVKDTEDVNEESNTENEDVMCESGSESLESKSDDVGSESEEGVTTDEGIEGSEDDTEETENIEKLKPAQITENVNTENLIE